MRAQLRGARKFYGGGIALYPVGEMYREMSFISYYFHWGQDEVMALDHAARRRWCEEISAINTELTPSEARGGKEKSITEMKF